MGVVAGWLPGWSVSLWPGWPCWWDSGWRCTPYLRTHPTVRSASAQAPSLPVDRDARRDWFAAEPMLQVSSEDSRQGVPAATPARRSRSRTRR